jgi:hypothetical protein
MGYPHEQGTQKKTTGKVGRRRRKFNIIFFLKKKKNNHHNGKERETPGDGASFVYLRESPFLVQTPQAD